MWKVVDFRRTIYEIMFNQPLGKLPRIKKYLQGKIFERFFHHTHIAVSEVVLLYWSIMVL